MESELEKAHYDYERRKHEILTKLDTMKRDKNIHHVYKLWIEQTKEFIKEREI